MLRIRSRTARHTDCVCFGCLREIHGIRWHCADCQLDLCERCEQLDPHVALPQSAHEAAHILLKIRVPLDGDGLDALSDAGERARGMERFGRRGDDRRGWSPERGGRWRRGPPPGRPPFDRGPLPFDHGPPFGPPPFGPPDFGRRDFEPPPWAGYGPPRHPPGPPPPPSVYLINGAAAPAGQPVANPLVPLTPATAPGA